MPQESFRRGGTLCLRLALGELTIVIMRFALLFLLLSSAASAQVVVDSVRIGGPHPLTNSGFNIVIPIGHEIFNYFTYDASEVRYYSQSAGTDRADFYIVNAGDVFGPQTVGQFTPLFKFTSNPLSFTTNPLPVGVGDFYLGIHAGVGEDVRDTFGWVRLRSSGSRITGVGSMLSSSAVVVGAVPEPATWVLVAGASLLPLRRRFH
jgi:hypothetical protein